MTFRVKLGFLFLFCFSAYGTVSVAQVAQERFGKNRVQFENKKWHYLKSNYFDVYYTDSTDRMAEFVAIKAEEYLPAVENEIGYTLPGRTEIVLYTNFADYLASNMGKDFMWQQTDGLAPTINSKIALYYNGYQNQLAEQVRQGLIHFLYRFYVLKDLQGDPDSYSANQSMPEWLITGYVAYKAKNWSSTLDDRLRNLMLNADYSSFDQFYFKHSLLAAHAFWYYLELSQGKEAPAAFHNLLRQVSQREAFALFFDKKIKEVKQDFMDYMNELYSGEEDDRETTPEGDELLYETESPQLKYYNFVVTPEEDNSSRAYIKYAQGETKVIFVDDEGDEFEILKLGYRFHRGLSYLTMPFLAWNNKGDQIAVAYPEEQKIKILLYNPQGQYKSRTFTLKNIDWLQSMKYDFQDEKLIMSAFKNGQSDIFVYDLRKNRMFQITNDPYDDLDPSPLLFSNKTSIIYSSNRPVSGTTSDAPSKLLTPASFYNIFTVDDWLDGKFRNINKLTNYVDADATSPIQYNSNYFTFLSDLNGINNRYLGRVMSKTLKTRRMVEINGNYFVNPTAEELQSALALAKKTIPDTTYEIAASQDSVHTFPISNLSSNLYESRSSGKANKITQVFYDGDYKTAYVSPQEKGISSLNFGTLAPSRFKINQSGVLVSPLAFETVYDVDVDTTKLGKPFFLVPNLPMTNFNNELSALNKDDGKLKETLYTYNDELNSMQMFKYKLKRFYVSEDVGLQTGLFTDRYQAYAGGAGPVSSSNGSSAGLGLTTVIKDIAEDYELYFGVNIGLDNISLDALLGNTEFRVGFNNFKRRFDWGVEYRISQNRTIDFFTSEGLNFYKNKGEGVPINQLTHYLDLKLEYPIDVLRSIRLKTQIRDEQYIYLSNVANQNDLDYPSRETKSRTALISRLEWVYDNTYKRALNLPDGLKYKVHLDWIVPVQDNTGFAATGNTDPNIINLGTDIRYYHPVYKDLTLAGRLALDMSFGDRKIIYYVGGADGWFLPQFSNLAQVDQTVQYSYQALALNLRGYKQNAINGSSAMTLNIEARVPTSTFTNQFIRSLFLRNIQLVVFTDLATAWNDFGNIERPTYTIPNSGVANNAITVKKTIGGIGPFIGGFGTGLRLRILAQYLKFDVAWNYDDFFQVSPMFYFGLGFDF